MPTGATISLQDTQSVIGLASTEYTFARDYSFKNSGDKAIEIVDAQLSSGENGIEFVSFVGASLPITLEPGQKIAARLSYNAPTDGSMRTDKLSIISTDRSYSFTVQAVRSVPGANGMANRQLPLTVVANPIDGTITVKLYAGFKGEVSIFNAAGGLVANQKNTNAWIWKATSNGKPRTNNEEYVVTVKAVDSDGSVLTRSERSVLTASK
jgi:hypothetical protein